MIQSDLREAGRFVAVVFLAAFCAVPNALGIADRGSNIARVSAGDKTNFLASIQLLRGLKAHEWYNGAAEAWWSAVDACPPCKIPAQSIEGENNELLKRLAYFRSLPDRKYYWHSIMQTLARVTIPKRAPAVDHPVRVLSVGLDWYGIEDEAQLFWYLNPKLKTAPP